ncbi:MAG: GNAT family protein [Caldilineaceae bacterium]
MSTRINALGQPIGPALPNWQPPSPPPRAPLYGRYCRLEPLDSERHSAELFATHALDPEGRNWTYLGYGPFADLVSYRAWMEQAATSDDPLFFAIMDNATNKAVGVASYLRITPVSGAIEVGHIHYSEALKRTPAATEAMYLMMAQAFALGYRRYEWKCDALNAPSRAAAQRLGFSYEGLFRQATVYKGRSRDTAWYSVIDADWPALRAAFERWLDPTNFDGQGRQHVALRTLTAPLLQSVG